jgi:hypothetical protein
VRKPKAQSGPPLENEDCPSCETTLWHVGQWRCDYWRPAGRWRRGTLRLFRNDRLVTTAAFGLAANEQSTAWRLSVQQEPDNDPR